MHEIHILYQNKEKQYEHTVYNDDKNEFKEFINEEHGITEFCCVIYFRYLHKLISIERTIGSEHQLCSMDVKVANKWKKNIQFRMTILCSVSVAIPYKGILVCFYDAWEF